MFFHLKTVFKKGTSFVQLPFPWNRNENEHNTVFLLSLTVTVGLLKKGVKNYFSLTFDLSKFQLFILPMLATHF